MCLSSSAITLKNQPDAENSKYNVAKVYFAVVRRLRIPYIFLKDFFNGCGYCPAGVRMSKVGHKKSRKNKDIYLLNQVQSLPAPGQENLFPCTPTRGKEREN